MAHLQDGRAVGDQQGVQGSLCHKRNTLGILELPRFPKGIYQAIPGSKGRCSQLSAGGHVQKDHLNHLRAHQVVRRQYCLLILGVASSERPQGIAQMQAD